MTEANEYRTFALWLQSTSETPPPVSNEALAQIAPIVAHLHGQDRVSTCDAELNKLDGRGPETWDYLATALRELDAPESEPLAAIPELPMYARLTPGQVAAAVGAGKWLDDFVTFASEASPMTPLCFHVALGLELGSLAIAGRLRLRVSTTEHSIYPNLYTLFVGPSTVQRKTTAMRTGRGVIKAAGLEHFLLADRQTPEALTMDLTTRIPQTYDSWPPDLQGRWLRERAIAAQRGWLLEEASHLLDSFNRDFSAGLLPIVLDLYDSPSEALPRNTVSRGRELIQNPYVSIFGVATYGAMAEHLANKVLWSNGFFARFAIVGSSEVGTWRFWPEPKLFPRELIDGLKHLATEVLPMPTAWLSEQETQDESGETHKQRIVEADPLSVYNVQLERDGEAWQAWERYAKATSHDMLRNETVSRQYQASYGRLGTMLIKVAMILAAFDTAQRPVAIEARHVYRALQIVEGWRANLHDVFANLRVEIADDETQKIREALASAGGGWISRRDLLRKLTVKWEEIEPQIDKLEAAGEIERRVIGEDKPGPKSEEYRLKVG